MKFEGSAFSWWKAAKGEYMTHRFAWGDFIALFYRHHCPRGLQLELELQDQRKRSLERKVLKLRAQGKMIG